MRKITHNISENTCKWIPLPPLNKEWTDEEVYKHFKLSEDDIKLINDTNIIGYKNIIKQTEEKKVDNDEEKKVDIYQNMKLAELKQLCKDKNIKGYSNKKKNELIKML